MALELEATLIITILPAPGPWLVVYVMGGVGGVSRIRKHPLFCEASSHAHHWAEKRKFSTTVAQWRFCGPTTHNDPWPLARLFSKDARSWLPCCTAPSWSQLSPLSLPKPRAPGAPRLLIPRFSPRGWASGPPCPHPQNEDNPTSTHMV